MNLRIITGSAKGQKLEVPLKGCRPMKDRVKSALFSIINNIIQGSNVLDLYAGTGALGIECLSRGANSVVFIDKSKYSVRCIKNNLEKTGFASLGQVIKCSVLRFIDEYQNFNLPIKKYDIIFFTPPYNKFKEKVLSKTFNLLAKNGILIAESFYSRKIKDSIENLVKIDSRRYGITTLNFYKHS
jgi:16S rRNA (guanine966-N2)-methyltransferase